MNFDEQPITQKRSLGALRKNPKTKPRSPDLTGQIRLQRHTMEVIVKQFRETESEEVVANIAGWSNRDSHGAYLTVELSPKYVPQEEPIPKTNNLDFLFNDPEEEHI
jgi:hypothetical protein